MSLDIARCLQGEGDKITTGLHEAGTINHEEPSQNTMRNIMAEVNSLINSLCRNMDLGQKCSIELKNQAEDSKQASEWCK
jgi:hypothetical protein